jgi:hypothetical protein
LPFIIFAMVADMYIKFKFDLWILQIKFEFCHGPMTFNRVIPLEEIFSFQPLTFVWMSL